MSYCAILYKIFSTEVKPLCGYQVTIFFYSNDIHAHHKSANPIKSVPVTAETISFIFYVKNQNFLFSSIYTIKVKNYS